MTWTTRLADQLDGHWRNVLRPRLAGLTDDYQSWTYATDADTALAQLDDSYEHWIAGVRALSEADLARPCGPAEGPYADYAMSELILHINREVIHHGAEIACLRDLYIHQ